jgi:hypothetical protein
MTKLRRVAERAGLGAGSGVRVKSRLRLYSARPERDAGFFFGEAGLFFVGAIARLLRPEFPPI